MTNTNLIRLKRTFISQLVRDVMKRIIKNYIYITIGKVNPDFLFYNIFLTNKGFTWLENPLLGFLSMENMKYHKINNIFCSNLKKIKGGDQNFK